MSLSSAPSGLLGQRPTDEKQLSFRLGELSHEVPDGPGHDAACTSRHASRARTCASRAPRSAARGEAVTGGDEVGQHVDARPARTAASCARMSDEETRKR